MSAARRKVTPGPTICITSKQQRMITQAELDNLLYLQGLAARFNREFMYESFELHRQIQNGATVEDGRLYFNEHYGKVYIRK